MKLTIIVALSFCLGLFGCAGSGPSSQKEAPLQKSLADLEINLNVRKKVLPNGLTILLVQNKKLPIFSFQTFYRVGSKNERPGITGISHFFEHMMFKGTSNNPPGVFDRAIEGNGGSNNAYTSRDLTVYYENMPKSALKTIVELEADRMVNLNLQKDLLNSERLVILEERRFRYENKPQGQIYQAILQLIFKGTPYEETVIGRKEDIKSVTREQMFEFYKDFYAPNNAVVVVAGDLDFSETFGMIEKHYGPLKASARVERNREAVLDDSLYKFKKLKRRTYHLKGGAPNPLFAMVFPGKPAGHPDSYTQDILSMIVGSGASSYLNERLVLNKKPRLNYVYSSNSTLEKSGAFFVMGELVNKENPKKFRRRILKELQTSCKKAITKRNVQKAKNNLAVSYYSELTTNDGLAGFIGLREIFYGDYSFYEKELGLYEAVTVEDVRKQCHKMFTSNDEVYVTVWKKNRRTKI